MGGRGGRGGRSSTGRSELPSPVTRLGKGGKLVSHSGGEVKGKGGRTNLPRNGRSELPSPVTEKK